MTNLLKKIYEKVASHESFIDGSAFLWQNIPRTAIEGFTNVDPDARIWAMIVPNCLKPVFGKIYKIGRDKGMNYLIEKGWIDPNSSNDGKRTFDRTYGLFVATLEAGVGTLGYCLYGEKSIKKAFIAGAASAAFTAFGNLNGRVLDSLLELNNLPNQGRGYIPKNMPLESKKKIRDAFNGVMVGYPIAYTTGMLATRLLN